MSRSAPRRHSTTTLFGSALIASCLLAPSAYGAAGGGNTIQFMPRAKATPAEVPCDPEVMVKSGTFESHVKTVGFLASVRWGDGILTLVNGEQHKFNVLGVKMLETGASDTHVTGEVYNLEKPQDLEGLYYGSGMDVALIKGEGEVIGKNTSNCVYIKARSATEGLKLSPPGPGGVEVRLAD